MSSNQEPEVHLRIDQHEQLGNVAWVTFDQARRLNVVGSSMLEKALIVLESLSSIDGLRAVVLSGAGSRAFIGGADIREFATFDETLAIQFITRIHKVCDAIRRLPVPSIARIQGYCLGAGMEIAAACDMRAADTSARFGMPEVRVGVPSVIEAALLPGLIGWGKTRELLLTGDMIDAKEAADCGFLQSLTEPGELDARVQTWLASILNSGPIALRLQKQLIQDWETLSLQDAVQRGIGVFGAAYRTDEPGRFTREFLDRKSGK